MNPNLDSLFFVALWAWMRAHPNCDFDEFNSAVARIINLMARLEAAEELESAQEAAP